VSLRIKGDKNAKMLITPFAKLKAYFFTKDSQTTVCNNLFCVHVLEIF